MSSKLQELVRIDDSGVAHPVGKVASQRMRVRKGAFRLMPAPSHLVVMRYVGEDGERDPEDGPVFRLAGEVTAPGALCDVYSLVGQAGWRGELVALDGETSRSIFFDHGHVVCATSSAVGERLGEVLYRYGALTEAQIAQTMQSVQPDVRFGEAAVKLGFLTRERLFHLMSKQTEEIVFATMRIGDGMYYFLETYDEGRLPTRQNINVQGLLMDGVRRLDEMKYFRERIPSDEHVPQKTEGKPPPAAAMQEVYEAVDGARSVAEICRIVGAGEFEVTQALFQLVQSGHVTIHAPKPNSPVALVELFNHAMAKIFREIDRLGRGGEVRMQLSEFASGAGVYDSLFRRAGPSADGTYDAERLIDNAAVMVGPEGGLQVLAQSLYEYAAFALFISEPHLRGGDEHSALTKYIAELLAPLLPQ